MANINDYVNDNQVDLEDKILSSDGRIGPDLGKTKNIKVETLKDFLGGYLNDKNFVHTQIASSNTWVVDHNLEKFPSVTVVDSAGTEVIGEVEHISINQTRISFSASFGGKAYFN